MRWLIAYLCSGLVFVGLDATWLTLAGDRLYRPLLTPILADRVSIPPAVAFYLIYLLGIVVLAVAPALKAGSARAAASAGAVLGLVAYATYDLTNQATLNTWSLTVTLADLAWGVSATTIAALAGYAGARRLAPGERP